MATQMSPLIYAILYHLYIYTGSEIDNQCPYHHTALDVASTQDSAFTIQECTCNLQGFAYSVRRYVEKIPYLDMDQPIDIDGKNMSYACTLDVDQ